MIHDKQSHTEIGVSSIQIIAADRLVLWALGAREGEHPGDLIGDCPECWSSVATHLANWLASRFTVGTPEWRRFIGSVKADIDEITAMDQMTDAELDAIGGGQ